MLLRSSGSSRRRRPGCRVGGRFAGRPPPSPRPCASPAVIASLSSSWLRRGRRAPGAPGASPSSSSSSGRSCRSALVSAPRFRSASDAALPQPARLRTRPTRQRSLAALPGAGQALGRSDAALAGSLQGPGDDRRRHAREAAARQGPAAARRALGRRGRDPGPRPHGLAGGPRAEQSSRRPKSRDAPAAACPGRATSRPRSGARCGCATSALCVRGDGRSPLPGARLPGVPPRQPYALGGEATVANIQLRCRSHNAYEARLYFGAATANGGAGSVREANASRTAFPHETSRIRTAATCELVSGRVAVAPVAGACSLNVRPQRRSGPYAVGRWRG